jgi:hypothetical protein
MSSEHEIYYQEVACGAAWVDEDPDACGCKGSGYWLSELDTWHKCRLHAPDAVHPEYEYCLEEMEEQEIVIPAEDSIPDVIDESDIPF